MIRPKKPSFASLMLQVLSSDLTLRVRFARSMIIEEAHVLIIGFAVVLVSTSTLVETNRQVLEL